MIQSYLPHLPRKYIRTVSGHDLEGSFFLARNTVQPSESLKGTVFPWVDEDMANFERDSSSYEGEVVCKGFLRLMQYMKIVFLQDSALVRRLYPDHPIFAHELFRSPEYRTFAAKIIDAEDNPEIPHNNRIQSIVPEISGSLRGIRQENQAAFNAVLKEVDGLKRSVKRVEDRQIRAEEWLERISNAEITIPAVRAQLRVPPTAFTLDPTLPSASSGTGPISTGETPREIGENPRETGENPPVYKLDRSVVTVTALWEEWEYGRGKPAVKWLNEEYGDSWRLNDRSFYSRRLGLIREIFQLAEDQRRVGDEEAVAGEIEKERQRRGKSLNWMCETWVKEQKANRV